MSIFTQTISHMQFEGSLRKMISHLHQPIQYYLKLGGDLIHCNGLLHRTISLHFIGYECVECGSDEKLFRMGFCKKCFFESPHASESIIRPELSRAHLGQEERDLSVEEKIQLVPHTVYLAYTGEVKVGVTRTSQVPTRWIDQGATFAVSIAQTNNRYEAGMIEVALKSHLSDRTNYKKMLRHEYESSLDLDDFRTQSQALFPKEYANFFNNEQPIVSLDYPYTPPNNIFSFSLDKRPQYSGKLIGIKGQYLVFEDGAAFNVRGHEGYFIRLSI